MIIEMDNEKEFQEFSIRVTFQSVDEIRDLMMRLGLSGKQIKEIYDEEAEVHNEGEYMFQHDPSRYISQGHDLYNFLEEQLELMGWEL